MVATGELRQAVEVCDESGQVLGLFYPTINGARDEDPEPPISEEELARRSKERRGRSLAEIMADLEKRA